MLPSDADKKLFWKRVYKWFGPEVQLWKRNGLWMIYDTGPTVSLSDALKPVPGSGPTKVTKVKVTYAKT